MSFKIEATVNEASITKVFASIEEKLTRAVNAGVDKLGEYMVDEARVSAATKFNLSDKFSEGIQYHPINTGYGKVTAEVFNHKDVEYANFMEFGNLPVVNNPNYMVFQIDGQWVSTKNRKAIGEEHLHFFSEAVEKVSAQAQNIVDEEISKLNRE